MTTDESAIRELIAGWQAATRAGDLATVLSLMTDDVVFQVPGRAPFGKAEFESIARASTSGGAPAIQAEQQLDELTVMGAYAYVRSSLRIIVTPPTGAPPIERAGTTLTIFRKENGRWLLARDANLLVKV